MNHLSGRFDYGRHHQSPILGEDFAACMLVTTLAYFRSPDACQERSGSAAQKACCHTAYFHDLIRMVWHKCRCSFKGRRAAA